MKIFQNRSKGFVILYAVIVSTVVLTVGVSLMNIITKQLVISSIGRGSKIAYYSALNGKECYDMWLPSGTFFGSMPDDKIIYCGGGVIEFKTGAVDSSDNGLNLGINEGIYDEDIDDSGHGVQRTIYKMQVKDDDTSCVIVRVMAQKSTGGNKALTMISSGYNLPCDKINTSNPRKVKSEVVIGDPSNI